MPLTTGPSYPGLDQILANLYGYPIPYAPPGPPPPPNNDPVAQIRKYLAGLGGPAAPTRPAAAPARPAAPISPPTPADYVTPPVVEETMPSRPTWLPLDSGAGPVDSGGTSPADPPAPNALAAAPGAGYPSPSYPGAPSSTGLLGGITRVLANPLTQALADAYFTGIAAPKHTSRMGRIGLGGLQGMKDIATGTDPARQLQYQELQRGGPQPQLADSMEQMATDDRRSPLQRELLSTLAPGVRSGAISFPEAWTAVTQEDKSSADALIEGMRVKEARYRLQTEQAKAAGTTGKTDLWERDPGADPSIGDPYKRVPLDEPPPEGYHPASKGADKTAVKPGITVDKKTGLTTETMPDGTVVQYAPEEPAEPGIEGKAKRWWAGAPPKSTVTVPAGDPGGGVRTFDNRDQLDRYLEFRSQPARVAQEIVDNAPGLFKYPPTPRTIDYIKQNYFVTDDEEAKQFIAKYLYQYFRRPAASGPAPDAGAGAAGG